ncbi:MAG: metal ABC transporter permease [Chlamydia sp.]
MFSQLSDSIIIFDPVLRGPFFTCIAMGMLGGLLGVWLFFQRQLLIGEVLSHAIFPGMVFGYIMLSFFASSNAIAEQLEIPCILIGGLLSAYIAILGMQWTIKKKYASQDSALSFTLASTFGIGLLAISSIQNEYPGAWRSLTSLFVGQAATIPNHFAWISFIFVGLLFFLFTLYQRGVYAYLFDATFANIHGLMSRRIQSIVTLSVIITAILGVRLVGVVLMSAMLTFPPVIARSLCNRIASVTICSIILGGALSGLGVYLSHLFSTSLFSETGRPLWIPTGPIIVLLMSLCFLLSLLFSPKQGILARICKRRYFSWRSNQENILKFLWKSSVKEVSVHLLLKYVEAFSPIDIGSFSGRAHYYFLEKRGYILRGGGEIEVLPLGLIEGKRLVRLHRLWELYLVEKCGMEREKVHPSAEEMEHILTAEMESELMMLLDNPTIDPHKQPIPPRSSEELLWLRKTESRN